MRHYYKQNVEDISSQKCLPRKGWKRCRSGVYLGYLLTLTVIVLVLTELT